MPFSGGVFSIVNTFVPGTTILSAAVNANFSDIATGLSDCLTRDNQAGMTAPLRLTDGAVATPSLTYNSETGLGLYRSAAGKISIAEGGALVATIDGTAPGVGGNVFLTGPNAVPLMPIGFIGDFAGSSAPAGWLLCYGQSLLRSGGSGYPELFAAIGTTYGAADGSHFSLPDCRGRGSFGQDNMGGSAANRITAAGGNFDGTVLGGTGGQQNATVAQANLPNVAFTVSGIALNDPGHTHNVIANQATNTTTGGVGARITDLTIGGNFTGTNVALSHTTGITVSSQGTAASGGSGTAVAVLSNAIIFNKIIFAGR